MYKCDRCGKVWEKKTFFFRQLKRKYDCKPVISNVSLGDIRKQYNLEDTNMKKCKSNVSICKYCKQEGCKMCKSKCKYFVSIEENLKKEKNCKKLPNSNQTDTKKTLPKKSENIIITENILENENIENKKFICHICNKEYKHRQSLYNHQKKGCYQMQQITTTKNDWEKERVELYGKINMLLENISKQKPTIIENQTIQNIETQNTTINQTNIIINGFGTENMEYITDKIKTHLLKTPGVMIQKLIKFKHFNEDHPENCNIKLSLKDGEVVETYSALNGWETKDKKILIDNIVETNFSLLDFHYDKTNGGGLDSMQKERFQLFSDKFSVEPRFKESISTDTELILNNGIKLI